MREERVKQAQEEKKNKLKIAADLAEQERLNEIERIKELRIRKGQLEKTLAESQKLIYKQCYSRPLWPLNRCEFEFINNNEDFKWLTNPNKDDFNREIVDELFKKVTGLEDVVANDVAFQKRVKYQQLNPLLEVDQRDDHSDSRSSHVGYRP